MRCFYHQDKDANVICKNCNKAICSDCTVNIEGEMYCPDCFSIAIEYQKKYPTAKFAVKSFDPRIVRWFKKHTDAFPAGLLIASHPSILIYFGSIFLHFPLNHYLKPDFLSVDKKIVHRTSIQKFRKDHPVLCWTIQDESEYNFYKNKADNLIFEKY